MPATARNIIGRAIQESKTGNIISGVPQGMTAQALDELNAILAHIADTVDFSAARGQWNFTFNPNLTTTGGGNIVATGPNPMPMDYLRVGVSGGSTGSQRSSKWYIQGVPYDMIELDLTELDDQVQQAGIQSYPYFWAKDMAQYQPVIEVTGNLTANSQTVSGVALIDTTQSLASIANGMSVAGGIGPRSTVVPGSTLSGITGGGTGFTLSAAAVATMTGATLLIGNPAAGYAYPPPSGAYNAMIRYQRRMPRLTQAQVDAGAYPWFSDDLVLVDALIGKMMGYSGDSRQDEFLGRFERGLGKYLKLADDNANRAQTVQMDRRYFGTPFRTLKNTKTVGW